MVAWAATALKAVVPGRHGQQARFKPLRQTVTIKAIRRRWSAAMPHKKLDARAKAIDEAKAIVVVYFRARTSMLEAMHAVQWHVTDQAGWTAAAARWPWTNDDRLFCLANLLSKSMFYSISRTLRRTGGSGTVADSALGHTRSGSQSKPLSVDYISGTLAWEPSRAMRKRLRRSPLKCQVQ